MAQQLKFQFTTDTLKEAVNEMLNEGKLSSADLGKYFGDINKLVEMVDDSIYEMEGEDLEDILKERAKATVEMMVDMEKDGE